MISHLNLFRSANALVKLYGQDAELIAIKKATKFLDAGDLDSYAAWKGILQAVKELQRKKPEKGEIVH